MSKHRTARTTALTGVFLFALAGSQLAGQLPARAATFTVTTFADVVSPVDGVTSLREAFAAASSNGTDDTIVLAAGSYHLTSCTGPLSHTEGAALTVQGNGATITQTCADTGVIESTDDVSSLTLTDLGIVGGPNSGAFVFGPGVYGEGAVRLDTVTVTGVDGGPTGASAAVTGSNNMPGAPMTIVDSQITGNDSDGVTGSNVSFVLTRSTISHNGGAGVNLTDGTPVTVTGSTIADNAEYGLRTTGQGHTRVTVTGSKLRNNGSTGLLCSACASLDLNGSSVTGNGDSGVDFSYDFDPVGPDRHIAISNSTVNRNTSAGPGGGISVTTIQTAPSDDVSPLLTIDHSTISGNKTTGSNRHGGGVYSRVGALRVESSTISDNSTGSGLVGGPSGGGIYFVPDADGLSSAKHNATIIHSTITGNSTALNGGGAYLDSDGAVQLLRSKVAKNETGLLGRGGGLWVKEATPLLIEKSTIASNRAARGGGVYVAGRTSPAWAVIADTTLSGNWAREYGGGVLVAESASATLRNTTVSANRAGQWGGGIQAGTSAKPRLPVQEVWVEFSTVRGNRAPQGGNLGARSGVVKTVSSVFVAATGPGCTFGPSASLTAFGYTFTDHNACAGHPTDVVSAADPKLGPLADNGGPTRTHLPASTSPLAGLVPAASCSLFIDQRGQARPQGAGCEPGSVEVPGKRRS
ncbi:MAG: right-handed parallel beta-helix repeat-containing protein [Micropruina sp.]|uniref:right-handed parallel beta-helix repeat-containing protein n=1 Tax=Micropruina sp. TaxID=2737536 RepID=UPI0039E5D3E9